MNVQSAESDTFSTEHADEKIVRKHKPNPAYRWSKAVVSCVRILLRRDHLGNIGLSVFIRLVGFASAFG